MPGRGTRGKEPCAEQLAPLVQSLADALMALTEADGLPLVLFGFSFGALVAFETALQLQRSGFPPLALVGPWERECCYREEAQSSLLLSSPTKVYSDSHRWWRRRRRRHGAGAAATRVVCQWSRSRPCCVPRVARTSLLTILR